MAHRPRSNMQRELSNQWFEEKKGPRVFLDSYPLEKTPDFRPLFLPRGPGVTAMKLRRSLAFTASFATVILLVGGLSRASGQGLDDKKQESILAFAEKFLIAV